MDFRELNLKLSYDSDRDDILRDFYVHVLSNSINYKRLVGFFSSSSLAIAAKGISNFIRNKGQMQLLCGINLTKADIMEIKKAYKNPQEVIENSILNDFNSLEEGIVKDHVGALGWMIANEMLEIKIALLVDNEGMPLENGILHQKIGILEDSEGNMISFSGSNNETAFAWKFNIEEFKVFRNWINGEKGYFNSDLVKFVNYWEGQSNRMNIIDIPDAVKNEMIKMAPPNYPDIDLRQIGNKTGKSKKVKLWDYQKEAIHNWQENGKKGIFEMATGTGKTFTALGCLDSQIKESKQILCIITSPFQHLVQQWKQSIEEFGIDYDDLIIADSSNSNWRDNLADSLMDISIGDKNVVLLLPTHRTFSSRDLTNIIRENKEETTIFLIADEVHGLGAKQGLLGLNLDYELRLGLSATPKRWFDDEGTQKLYEYFGDVVYEFDLKKAISKVNPATGKTYLTPFRYKPIFVSLTRDELIKYAEISRLIAIRLSRSNQNFNDVKLEKLLFKRAKIKKNAIKKNNALNDILNTLGPEIASTIIYCDKNQMNNIMNTIFKKGIEGHKFTMKEGTKPNKKYRGLSEREDILLKFSEREYKVLVAMKCLDEGVDIPSAKIAIFMSSSGNPREYIQRIGRVIRRHKDKREALIFDIIVIPNFENIPSDLRSIELKIFKKELERYEEISKVAINDSEALDTLNKIKKKIWG